MKVIGVIPARWGSTRFPGKSLALLAGRPMIQWVIENAGKARRLDALLVATDDRRIYDTVTRLGAEAVMTRPDHPSGTDRIAEAVASRAADIVVNIQGDEPLIDPALVDRLAGELEAEGSWDMSTAAARIDDERELANPSVVKVVWDARGGALYFSRAAIPFVRDGEAASRKALHWRHLGIYAYRRTFLDRLVATPPCGLEMAEKLEQLRALHIGGRIKVVEAEGAGRGVDTPEDARWVERILQQACGSGG